MRPRTGRIYEEFTNPGTCHTAGRFVRGVGMVAYKHRYVAEIHVNKKRYRFRSTNYDNCRWWLDGMLARFKDE